MRLTRIKVQNFKTYLNLDLDLEVVAPEKPIILIGGLNGGGKTTLFEAISGGLYGLKVENEYHFRQYFNAGIPLEVGHSKITIELHFVGIVIGQKKKFQMIRTYLLNTSGKIGTNVTLNMDGTKFSYGTTNQGADKKRSESEINKIIRTNLPQELSRYFLFDAMESGNLLKESELNQVIKDNIENVMGFNKYRLLGKAVDEVYRSESIARQETEEKRKKYELLAERKKSLEVEIDELEKKRKTQVEYLVEHKEEYKRQKELRNAESTLQEKIRTTEEKIKSILKNQENYRKDAEYINKNLIEQIGLPKLAESLLPEIEAILKSKEQTREEQQTYSPDVIENIVRLLQSKGLLGAELDPREVAALVLKNTPDAPQTTNESNPYDLEQVEIDELKKLISESYSNDYPRIAQQKEELVIGIQKIPAYETEIKSYIESLNNRDVANFTGHYERMENEVKKLEAQISDKKGQLAKAQQEINTLEIATDDDDPKYLALQKLKGFFDEVSDRLLKSRKQQIEENMRKDLNQYLLNYKDMISRVELSESLEKFSFKIFHKAGNEIFTSQLNTAGKQIVIQTLLKALHEYGDYDPPVMIDTVMGVLDTKSRAMMIEHYFPTVSGQTILLSSDSEVRPNEDFDKIRKYISKIYTLVRDTERQCTEVQTGYFGKTI